MTRPATPAPQRSGVLALVAVVVGLEVVALLGVVALFAVETARGAAADPAGAVATAVVAAAVGTALALCVRALLAGRRWARAPLLTWQLFQIVLVAPLVPGPLWWAAVPAVVLGLAAGVCLVTRAVARAVGEEDPVPPGP